MEFQLQKKKEKEMKIKLSFSRNFTQQEKIINEIFYFLLLIQKKNSASVNSRDFRTIQGRKIAINEERF